MSRAGLYQGVLNVMRFTAIYLILMMIILALFDLTIPDDKSMVYHLFAGNIFWQIFCVIEFFTGYKKGKALEQQENESKTATRDN